MSEKQQSKYQGLQVIGAGLPRTATTSLHQALETLGYNPCHTFRTHIGQDPFPFTHVRGFQQAYRLHSEKDKPARQALLHQLYESSGVHAAVDAPTCLFVDDLIEMYPNAKVILGVRSSPEAWRKSFNDTIGRVMGNHMQIATALFPNMRFSMAPLLKLMDETSRRRYGHAWTEWDDLEAYTRHNDWVRKIVPKERLLEFEPSMGYGPICEFLGIDVPNDEEGKEVPFPRVNDSKGFGRSLDVFTLMGWTLWVVTISAMVGVARLAGFV